MNRQYRPYQMILTVLMALLSAACSTEKEPEVIPDVPVTPVVPPSSEATTVDLLLSVSTTQQESTTRQSAEATQNSGNFRGIVENEMKLIPFDVTRAITKSDYPMQLFSISPEFVEDSQYYYFATLKDIIIGTASFLCYGKAKKGEGVTDNFKNGTLLATHDEYYYPKWITFSPVPIYTSDVKGEKIAEYLTAIVNEVSSDLSLFNEFTKYSAGTYQPFAGSSTNIVKLVNQWYDKVSSAGAVTAKIFDDDYVQHTETEVTNFIDAYQGHPTNLPDGAAIIRWNSTSNKFEYLTEPTTGSDINRLDRYAYPAELYYYCNSQIKTSTAHKESEYKSTPKKSWSEILETYSTSNKAVDATTRSIAIEKALNYGVACLQVQVRAGGNKLFQDQDNVGEPSVTLSDNTFPLTAILVGGQHKQDFSFTPLYDDEEEDNYDDPTEDPEYLIYDKSIADEGICLGKYQKSGPEDTGNYSDPLYTLVLQSKEGKPVKVVLEFLNNSDVDFKCLSGIVYRGTKFYLMAEVTLPASQTQDYEKRVFTQDHKTTVQLTVSSLVNAYNALPNLSSDKLRIFETVQAYVKQWQDGDEQNKTIYNW